MSRLSQIFAVILAVGYVLASTASCSAGQLDDPTTQIVKTLSPKKQTDETGSIPNWFAPDKTQSLEQKRNSECGERFEPQCDQAGCRPVVIRRKCSD